MKKLFLNLKKWFFGRKKQSERQQPSVSNFNKIEDAPISAEYVFEIEENDKQCEKEVYFIDDSDLIAKFEFSATARNRGIDNTAPENVRENIRALNKNILFPFSKKTGFKKTITSGFRNAEVNAAVGGARTSQHTTGQAVDFRCYDANGRRVPVLKMARMWKSLKLPFDQMILYGTFLHLSFVDTERLGGKNRRQVIYHNTHTGGKL